MEVIEHSFVYVRADTFYIFPLGDIHAGSIDCAEGAIRDKVHEVATTRNALFIGLGDYSDCILKNDPRFDIAGLAEWVEKDNITESQRGWVRDLFKPIRKQGLALCTGNHEEEIHSRYQIDITRNLCKDLGIPYGGYSCFIVLTFNRKGSNESHQYIIHAWHGAGAAQSDGARLMRLMRLVNDIQADIYLMGHLHAMTQHTPNRLTCRRGKVKSIKLAATITGSWLKTYTQSTEKRRVPPSYGEKKGYVPSVIGCPTIYIRPDKDEFGIIS